MHIDGIVDENGQKIIGPLKATFDLSSQVTVANKANIAKLGKALDAIYKYRKYSLPVKCQLYKGTKKLALQFEGHPLVSLNTADFFSKYVRMI